MYRNQHLQSNNNIIKSTFFLVLILNISNVSDVNSQNFVPNGSFDNLKTCYWNFPFLDTMMENWSQYRYGAYGSVDAYNKCYYNISSSINFSVPSNISGYQFPKTGYGYTGLLMGLRPALVMNRPDTISYSVSEYVAVKLNQQLIQGNLYRARFFVSLVDSCYFGGDGMGMYISCDTMIFNKYTYANINAQIRQNGLGVIIDTANWTAISDTFTATGCEQYIFIGSFTADSAINKLHISGYPGPVPQFPPPFVDNYISYYVDDVAIWEADTIPPASNAGTDTTICLGGKAKLGEHHYGDYYYEWFTKDSVFNNYVGLLQNGFMKYSSYLNLIGDSGFINVSPTQTTTYYCLATDFTYTKTLDSVTVYVIDCGQANDTTVCIEQSFTLGTLSLPQYSYKWSPPTFLNYDTIGQPLCTPTNDITYSLIIKNSTNDTVSLDTTTILVGACHYAQAGIDSTICKGDSMQIGSHNFSFVSYLWSPNFMLSDTAIGNPLVYPDTSTYYFLQVNDTMGNVSFDSVLVGVVDCDTVGMEKEKGKSLKAKVRVYPNPASYVIIIEFEEIMQGDGIVEIYDVTGKKVQRQKFFLRTCSASKVKSNKISIYVGNLISGLYLGKVIFENGEVSSFKFVVE